MRSLALRARELVLEACPDAGEKVWPGWRVFGYCVGPGMASMVCGIAPLKERINLIFARGAELRDPRGILEGASKTGRHVKIASMKDLEGPAVRSLLRQAFAAHGAAPPRGISRARATRSGTATGRARAAATPTAAPGAYQVGGSKTVAVPVGKLFAGWVEERLRDVWLPGVELEIRKATPSKSLRITWPGGSNLQALFYARGAGKSMVAIDHRKLPDAEVPRMKVFWKERLTRLKDVLES